MTSQQVLLMAVAPPVRRAVKLTTALVLLTLLLLPGAGAGGCSTGRLSKDPHPLFSPYTRRQVWAVAPLNNESGTLHADGVRLADKLTGKLGSVSGIDALPVNRVLAAMDRLRIGQVNSREAALRVREVLGVDGLLVGTVSSYDPYDPPELGMIVELYADPGLPPEADMDVRKLAKAAVEEQSLPRGGENGFRLTADGNQPYAVVSTHLDAADPQTRYRLEDWARYRGTGWETPGEWRKYRISMDLYSEFVSHEVVRRVLLAEKLRLQQAGGPNVPPPPPETAEALRR